MRFCIVLAAGLALSTPIHALDPTCELTSSPLLKLILFTETRGNQPPSEGRTLQLICKDRRVLSASMLAGAADFPFTGSFAKGVATEASFRSLQDRMAGAKIGFMRNCHFFGPLLTGFAMQVTWFGRPGRMNSFKVYSSFSNDSAPCTPEELELVLDLRVETTQNELVSFP